MRIAFRTQYDTRQYSIVRDRPSCVVDPGVPASAQLGEGALDAADGLADALLVLDQREAHEPLAAGAEAHAGRHRDLGVLATSSFANSRLPSSSYGSGIGAHTNIVPRGLLDLPAGAARDRR